MCAHGSACVSIATADSEPRAIAAAPGGNRRAAAAGLPPLLLLLLQSLLLLLAQLDQLRLLNAPAAVHPLCSQVLLQPPHRPGRKVWGSRLRLPLVLRLLRLRLLRLRRRLLLLRLRRLLLLRLLHLLRLLPA